MLVSLEMGLKWLVGSEVGYGYLRFVFQPAFGICFILNLYQIQECTYHNASLYQKSSITTIRELCALVDNIARFGCHTNCLLQAISY